MFPILNLTLAVTIFFLAAGFGFLVFPLLFGARATQSFLQKLEERELSMRDKVLAPSTVFLEKQRVRPTAVTLAGILLSFILGYLFLQKASSAILLLTGSLAAFTDMLDGTLARLTKRITLTGGFLDGLRDDLLFLILTAGLLLRGSLSRTLLVWFLVGTLFIIFLKFAEIIAASRQSTFLNAFRKRVSGRGKLEIDRIKSFFYFVGLLLLLAADALLLPFLKTAGNIFIVTSIIGVTFSVMLHSVNLKFGSCKMLIV